MKLSLPRLLRHALLAAFSLCCVPPAWSITYWWEKEVCWVGADTSTISTTEAKTDGGSIYINLAIIEGVTGSSPTIGTLEITQPYTVNIDSRYSDGRPFQNLTIENIQLQTSGWDSDDCVYLHIGEKYTVTLGDASGASPSFLSANPDRYMINVDGTLRMSANDFAENRSLFTPVGAGIVELTGGVMDLSSSAYFQQEGTFWNPLFQGSSYHVNYTIAEGASVGVKMAVGYHGTVSNHEQYYINLKVTKVDATRVTDDQAQPTWYLTGDTSVESLLKGDKYIDQNTGTYAVFSDAEGLRFCQDSSLSCSGGTYVLAGNLSADSGVPITLRLQNSSLTLMDGEGALNQQNKNEGLIIEGDSSSVILHGVSTSTPNSIELGAGMALEINGPANLTLNSGLNSFAATSKLSKGDGGTLTYIGGTGNRLTELSNAQGELQVRNKLQATSVRAMTLKLNGAGNELTADSVYTGGNTEVSGGASLSTDYLYAGGDAEVAGLSSLSADSLYVVGNAKVTRGASLSGNDICIKGTTIISGSLSNDEGGVTCGNISIKCDDVAMADITNLRLGAGVQRAAATNIIADSVTHAVITVAASAAPSTLILGKVSNSAIALESSAVIADSSFTNSSISALGTGVSIGFDKVSLTPGGSISVGADAYSASVYTIPTTGSAPMMLSGTATSDSFQLDSLHIDTHLGNGGYLLDTPGTYTLMESGRGAISIEGISATIITAPGLVGTLSTDAATGDLLFELVDDTAFIINALPTNETSRNVAEIMLENAPAAGGTMRAIFDHLRDTTMASEAERRQVLDALSSNSVTILADAQRRGVMNTTNALRNRIIQMGTAQGYEPETQVHAWIQADGSYNDIADDDDKAGYKYSTWGGTVGVHADVDNFSFGAALSAAYGDLSTDNADRAEGTTESVTPSLFVRHQNGAFTQMGILSLGVSRMEMERHIHTYQADGEADGYTITAYYEAGYTFGLNEDATHVLQPIVSIMLTSAHMGDYSESGSIGNAGLCSDTEDYFYGTLGIGARYQVVLAEDVNERLSFLELRAKLVQDIGDETNEVTVSFSGVPGETFNLHGADVGRTGFQFGAGLSVPVGTYTTFFADVDADIRSGATSVNGGIGLRVEF